jgi:hypothetical protein
MTMQTSVDQIQRLKTASADPEFDFETLVPVILMSSVGLTLSLLIVAFVAS